MTFAVVGSAMGLTSTSGFDTTGAKLIVVHIASIGNTTPTLTDSNGNTWTYLSSRYVSGSNVLGVMAYCINPTVGASHTFSNNGTVPAMSVVAFSATGTVGRELDCGSFKSGTSINFGSMAPTRPGSIIVTGLNGYVATSIAIDSGFTSLSKGFVNGVNVAEALGYLIQTTIASVTPIWSWSGSGDVSACCTMFYEAQSSAGGGFSLIGNGGPIF